MDAPRFLPELIKAAAGKGAPLPELSPSVRGAVSELGTEPVYPLDVVKAICRIHPEYGGHRAKLVADFLQVKSAAEKLPVPEWLVVVAAMFDPPLREVHGRLVVAALAVCDPDLGVQLVRTRFLQEVLKEMYDVPRLRPEVAELWDEAFGGEMPWPVAEDAPQTREIRPSATVHRVHEFLGRLGIAAGRIVELLFRFRPEYVDGAEVGIDWKRYDDPHRMKPVSEWLAEAGAAFEAPVPEMHTRLLVVALALLEEPLGRDLAAAGLLSRMAAGLHGAPKLRPEYAARWQALTGVSWDEIIGMLPPDEAVPAHSDDPAIVDQLGRRPFAEVVAARMDEVWAAQRAKRKGGDALGAFMVHVHGPWGSGKSSVLNFLREQLQDEGRHEGDRWIVVDFNAWRHQRIRPPWWSLIREIYAQSARELGFLHSLRLRARWFWWRFRADWLPAAVAVVLIVFAVALTVGAIVGAVPDSGQANNSSRDDLAKSAELALKVVMAVLTAFGAVLAAGRTLAFGSARAAQAYTDLRNDPLGPIVRLFEKLVREIGRPVAVFVDDLDRCDGAYVVELLEGIQTLFRTAPVTYVIAADRKWICSSFEKHYGDFGPTIGEPGRPLGYLFLDKLFQVSASVPRPPRERQDAYWKSLLRAAGSSDPVEIERKQREVEQRVEKALTGAATQEQMERRIERLDPGDQQAARNVAARLITTSPEAQRATEHRLQRFAALLEPNPRAMKRLVNAFGLHQAAHLIEGRQVRPEALARWTIVELRWPLLADYLSDHPHAVASVGGEPPAGAPDALKPLFERDPEVLRVIHGALGGAAPLDEPAIRRIVGDPGASAEPQPAEAPKQIPAGLVQQIQTSRDSAAVLPSPSFAPDETVEAAVSSTPPVGDGATSQAPAPSA